MSYHNPVLLNPCIDGLQLQPGGIYVDVTFGGGGHSRAILDRLSDDAQLIAFDQDPDAQQNALDDDRFTLLQQNFRFLKNNLRFLGITQVDGILADLGVSSHQFDVAERGFSTRFDGPLDMRMDQHGERTAAHILNTYEEAALRDVFKWYGEVEHAGRLVAAIVKARAEAPILTGEELKKAIASCLKRGKENQYLAQVYQALRIEVNNELQVLTDFLKQALDVLKPGGRLVVISYHSLEDRLVKNFMRSGKFDGEIEKDFYGNPLVPFELITRKPIVPDDTEIKENNRARSAKLRIAQKK